MPVSKEGEVIEENTTKNRPIMDSDGRRRVIAMLSLPGFTLIAKHERIHLDLEAN
jgi:hypothetical protein